MDTSIDIITDTAALEALHRSEIDQQISTAKGYPRSITSALREAETLATLDHETAASCFYCLPRGGKKIEGPSVRLAEIVASSWGNLRYGARVVQIDAKFITAQGACHDLEKNVSATYEVRRRITDSKGRRYSDDMITTTANAACSIALRNAIFKVIPFAVVRRVYDMARHASLPGGATMAAKRDAALGWYRQQGATDAQVLSLLGRTGIDDITVDDLISLRGLCTAIRDGDTTLAEALRPKDTAPISDLGARLAAYQHGPPATTTEREPGADDEDDTPAGYGDDGAP